jgi:hypothetical protein
MTSIGDIERNRQINYINDNIAELKIAFRKEILQIIIYSNVPDEKIIEKGNGSQIKFSDLDSNLIKNIYNYIQQKNELPSEL